ncbi:transcription factor subunit Med10 of mediator complex-domain-containing protein [Glomus cerebriforme]|uniref:Mediator of RNA polymerase II transcription subunit 10 n=1 Tax=Glomus cerebriforme TaxID=658196 RepID=A0A397SAD8_9GLOM|nr:transcription factor subunit Med10 of mediator complex-domain-containing protein [Glomus cerebriforme]
MATASEPEQTLQQNGHSDPRTQLEDTIDSLLVKIWEIMVQLNDYNPNPDQKWVLSRTLSDLADCFEEIHKLQEKIKHIEVPLEVIEYIDEGRNPDKFMIDYVEEVMEESASMNVKNEAIQDFSKLLLEQLQESFPEQTDFYKQCQSSKSKTTNGH